MVDLINPSTINKFFLLAIILLSLLFICTCATSTQNNTTSKDSIKVHLKDLAGTKAPQTVRQL